MKQKLFTLLLAFIAAISFAGAKDIASGTFKNGGSWKISEQGELYVDAVTIPDYKLTSKESGRYYVINIDNDIDGYYYDRWHTSAPWNSYMPQIKTLRLSSSVKTIGTEAFAHLNLLTKVTIEGSGIIIKDDAFNGCFRLYDFPFASGKITSIGQRAFVHCAFLTIELNGVTYIGDYAFEQCYRLWRRPQDQTNGNFSIKVTGAFPTVEVMPDYSSGVVRDEDFLATDGHTILTTTRTRVEKGSKLIVVSDTKSSGAFSSNGVGEVVMGGDGWRFSNGSLTVTSQQLPYNSASDAPWYAKRNNVTYLSLNAQNIPANLFMNYTALQTVNLPEDVISIGDNAFNGCTNLTKVVNLDKVKSIGAVAFSNTKLNVTILNSAQTIGNNAFDNVTTMSQLILGENLTSIGAYAFRNTLQSQAGYYWIKVAGVAPNTASNAFDGVMTKKLFVPAGVYASYNGKSPWTQFNIETTVDFPVTGTNPAWELTWDGTLTILGSVPNYTNESDQPWFPYKNYIKKVVFGSNVTIVGNNALSYANENESKITEVVVPASVTEIGENAFKNNDQIEEVKAEGVQTIGNQAFENCSSLEKVKFGKDLSSIGNKAFNYCGLVDVMAVKAAVPPTVTAQTFVGLGRVSNNAPAKAKAKYAARRATAATGQKAVSLDVPESSVVTYANTLYWNLFSMDYIGEHGSIEAGDVFGNGMWILYADSTMIISCSSLETGSGLQDQNTVHDWGTNAGKIKRIEVLGELTELYRSFNNLPNLESVSFSSSVKKLYSTFRNCPKLKEVPLNDVEEFREYGSLGCFEQCTSLTDVQLANARIIGFRCFAECTALKTVEFPSVDTIENVAFVNCPALESVTVSNAYIGNAFRGCTGLKEVTLNGVKGHVIPSEAFKGCTALETVRINGSLHSVENDAFNGTALTDIYLSSPYPATVANQYNSNVFSGLTLSDITLHVPADFVNRYNATYNNPVWSRMNVVADEDYSEALIPVSGPLGSNGTWELGSDRKLTINCNGAMPTAQAATGQDSYSDTWYDWMPYVAHIEFTKTTTSVASNAFGLYLGDNNFASVGAITLGAGMQQIDDRGLFLKFQNGGHVYCYAENPPMLNGSNSFNWSEITGKNVTLHVLTKSGVLAQYQNAAGWQNFPNIVADLGPRYKVSWDADNGYIKVNESGIDLNAVPEGTTIHLTAVPYSGYWLKKWNNYNPSTGLTVSSDVSVSAEFTTNYLVSFYTPSETFAGQYTLLKRDTVEAGQAATAPADPTREGYRFMGWDCSFDSIVKQTAVHAQFEPIVYAESVKVSPEVKSVQVPSAELGTKTFQCYATVTPGNADNNAVTWSSDDADVATVDANGLVTIHNYGAATITATAADGSDVSGKCLLGVFSTDYMPVIQGTAIAVENGITEITMTKGQSAKLVNLVVTPEDYNGGISVMHHGPLQVNPCGEGEKTLPAFFIKPEMGSTYPYDDTITFRMNDYDHQAVHSMPVCKLIVHVTDDALFTAKTVEGVDMTFRITDPMTLTCEVYGYMEQLMMPDPVTGLPFVMHPAVDATTTGKITVPAVAKGCTVTNLSQQAFAGCSGLTEIELENGIQYIKAGAFQECSALQKLILPKSIKGLSMLGSMPQLANVYMYNPEPPIGWEIAENGENMMPDIAMTNAFQMIASNATLHVARGSLNAYNKAPWTTWFATITDDVDATFTVRFVDWDDSEIEVQNVDYGASAKYIQAPTRDGHEFTGWDKDFSRITANLTVKAQYAALSYTVTFLSWDGTQLGAAQQVTYGQSAVAPAAPARSGYMFAGWSADFSFVTGDMTIKAMYAKEGQYLVTFTDWDNSTLKCEIVDAGGSATAPEDPVREGYIFAGWSGSYTNVNADLTIQALYNDATGIEEIFTRPDAPAAVKILHDGILYIIRPDGKTYNAQGAEVR
ncbi:MAG: leucine-rich repeat protein [Paludibacteraceae bacterium]|nr:leucine-rich repeat protein [Paludibacteraceae bacterium]